MALELSPETTSTSVNIGCVSSVSAFSEQRTRNESQRLREKRSELKSGEGLSIFRAAKTENPVLRRSSVFFCSETTGKRLLHMQASVSRPFPHFYKQHQLEAWTDNTVICPPEPRSHFFVFSQSGVTQESLVACMTDV